MLTEQNVVGSPSILENVRAATTKGEVIDLIKRYRDTEDFDLIDNGEFDVDRFLDRHCDKYVGGHSDPALWDRCKATGLEANTAAQELANAVLDYCERSGSDSPNSVVFGGILYRVMNDAMGEATADDAGDSSLWIQAFDLGAVHDLG